MVDQGDNLTKKQLLTSHKLRNYMVLWWFGSSYVQAEASLQMFFYKRDVANTKAKVSSDCMDLIDKYN
jgi:hypothetical protein